MSDPKRLAEGVGFGDITRGAPRPAWCGGALLRITREQYREHERDGLRFETRSMAFPLEGLGDARVLCDGEVMQVMRDGRPYLLGLCSRCAALEANNRAELRARKDER